MTALFRRVDCHSIPVADLDAALAFYRDGLGHELVWQRRFGGGIEATRLRCGTGATHRQPAYRDRYFWLFRCRLQSADLLKRAGRWLQGHLRFGSVCAP